jgi:hypothetical protein
MEGETSTETLERNRKQQKTMGTCLSAVNNKPPLAPAKRIYHLQSKGGEYQTDINVSIPTPLEECPITMEKISEYKLDFLDESQTLFKGRVKYTKATLECGHSFNALAVLYHFVRSGMKCPCCREGHADKLSDTSIPEHIRKPMLDHYRHEMRSDEREADLESARAIVDLLQSEVGAGNVHTFLEMHTVELFIYSYESMDSLMPIDIKQMTMRVAEEGQDISCSTFGYDMRTCAINRRLMPIEANVFELVVGTRNLYNGTLMLDRTEKFHVNSIKTSPLLQSYRPMPGTTWTAGFLRGENKMELDKIAWKIPTQTFLQKVTEEGVAMRGL